MEFKEGRDADRIVMRPEEGTHDLLGCIVPYTVGTAFRIGIGKENDLVVLQGNELLDLYFIHTAGGEPDVLGVKLT